MTIEFTSRIDAPVEAVFRAFTEPERTQEFSDTVRYSKLLRSEGNQKVVEFEMVVLGQPQRLAIEFTFVPDEQRVALKTVESQFSDLSGEYRLSPSPDGTKTLLTYTGTAKDKVKIPVPLAFQECVTRNLRLDDPCAQERARGTTACGRECSGSRCIFWPRAKRRFLSPSSESSPTGRAGILNDGGQALCVFCQRTNERGSHIGLPLRNQIQVKKGIESGGANANPHAPIPVFYPRPWRRSLPGVALVHFPSSKVTSPFTMIQRYPSAYCTRRHSPAGKSWTIFGLSGVSLRFCRS